MKQHLQQLNEINETFIQKIILLKIGDFQKNDFDLVLFDMTFINNSLKEKGNFRS